MTKRLSKLMFFFSPSNTSILQNVIFSLTFNIHIPLFHILITVQLNITLTLNNLNCDTVWGILLILMSIDITHLKNLL